MGEVVDLNCTSNASFPEAELSWYVNSEEVRILVFIIALVKNSIGWCKKIEEIINSKQATTKHISYDSVIYLSSALYTFFIKNR